MAGVPKVRKLKKGRLIPFEETLMAELRDPEAALDYIDAAIEEGLPLEIALADVIRAQGMAKVARRVKMERPNLIRALRPKANPTLSTFRRLLHGVGLELAVRMMPSGKGKRTKV